MAAAPGQIHCGGVFRDYLNSVSAAFTSQMALVFPFQAELLAIQVAEHQGRRYLWLEVNSFYIVSLFLSFSIQVPWKSCLVDGKGCQTLSKA